MKIKSILIVDDNDSDQFYAGEIINEYDSSITISNAYDGEEALERLDELDHEPCLILLDINMPGMNGFEFLEHYDRRENKNSIIAMLSSSDQEQDKVTTMQYAFVKKYLVKPIKSEDIDALDALL